MAEIIVRRSTLTGVDVKLRLIDLIAVPYEEETDVVYRGEPWREVFDRGAFTGIENRAGQVRVNREHIKGDTVGKVVHFDSQDDRGLVARVKIAETARGDETLALAEEDMIGASVGYFVKQPSAVQVNRRTNVRRVMKAFIDHLGMVESPAYEGAKVLAVREGPPAPDTAGMPAVSTPTLDALRDDEVFAWAADRLAHPHPGDPS